MEEPAAGKNIPEGVRDIEDKAQEEFGVEKTELGFYKGRRVLVTGHTGFKGAWMCRVLQMQGADVVGYALAPPTEPNLFELAGISRGMTSVIGDICDFERFLAVFKEHRPEIVLHLAAQPLVRESYKDPVSTYRTNVMGTVHVLEAVRQCDSVKSVVNVTTDKVYTNREWEWGYRESDALDGYDPYSNSKSCSELVTAAYKRSFFGAGESGPAVSTARAGNVIGGGDFAKDRILPDCVRAAGAGKEIVVRNPHSVRPYQHVLEPVCAYLKLAKLQWEDRERYEGSYNIGPDDCDCITTGELTELFCRSFGPPASWRDVSEPGAPHEAGFLKLDCSRIRRVMGWRPRWQIGEAVAKTVAWSRIYLEGKDVAAETDRQILEYLGGGEPAAEEDVR